MDRLCGRFDKVATREGNGPDMAIVASPSKAWGLAGIRFGCPLKQTRFALAVYWVGLWMGNVANGKIEITIGKSLRAHTHTHTNTQLQQHLQGGISSRKGF